MKHGTDWSDGPESIDTMLIVDDEGITEHDIAVSENAPKVYVPSNFDAKSILGCDLKWADAANWLIDRIYVNGHFAMRQNVWGFTPLKAAYLRQVIPQTFERQLRHELEDAGVIECDHYYMQGQKSFGYRLAPRYRTKHKRISIEHPLIQRNIEQVRRGDLKKLSKVHLHLFEQFDRLTIDLEDIRVTDPERLLWMDFSLLVVDQLRTKQWSPVVCDYGRFHTPLTRMMSEFRNGLRLDGQRTVSLDLCNSQPLFLSVLFIKVLSKKSNISEFLQEDQELIDTLTKLNIDPSEQAPALQAQTRAPYTMGSLINWKEVEEDVKKYLELTQNGELYDFLSHNSSLSRRDFKQRLFKDVFFGQNFIKTPLTEEFDRLFPNVLAFIRRIKRGNYARLAWLMQKQESRLMIDTVCGRLMNDFPQMPLLTIHDSILTTPEYVGSVRHVIAEEFSTFGLQPTIKVEAY